ncbi:hypothetical protein CCGE531_33470 (plasmid) [Rhizobium sp. CCGE531]|nr:hypothetical protein CCGE531_33470 [Rhizobium sp. CCGE531]AYG77220.1 hypothetical protein CCGE532_32630 [Rhizobium sp. CCGE532]
MALRSLPDTKQRAAVKPRDIDVSDFHIDTLKVTARRFRKLCSPLDRHIEWSRSQACKECAGKECRDPACTGS